MKTLKTLAICALVLALNQATTWAQGYGAGSGVRKPVSQVSYRSMHSGGGCSTCSSGAPAPACGCEATCGAAPSCGGCGGCNACRPCCPRILPAIVRGLDCAIDRVGDTLACILNPPRYSCCAPACCDPQPCCVAKCAPRVVRPSYRFCDDGCGSCGPSCGSGCTSGCSGRGAPAMNGDPFGDEPAAPPMPPGNARTYRQSPGFSQAAPKSNLRPTSTVKPVAYGSGVSTAKTVGAPTPAAPRSFQADSNASELSPEDVRVKSIRRTSATSTSSNLPKNPLR